jgi:hypothetical protein
MIDESNGRQIYLKKDTQSLDRHELGATEPARPAKSSGTSAARILPAVCVGFCLADPIERDAFDQKPRLS